MKIYIKNSYNGSVISGDCVMLHRYGDVYPCIDNAYHPNPGTEEDEYSEIERPVDWLITNKLTYPAKAVRQWIAARMSHLIEDDPDISLADAILDTMYNDGYTLSEDTEAVLTEIYEALQDPKVRDKALQIDELSAAREIAEFINEDFLRVRAGGKLNPDGTNSIYFRISSHGYDQRSTIEDFIWDTFGGPDKMPNRIWIGHDAETNPPEITLFDGTPSEFFDRFDNKIAASTELE